MAGKNREQKSNIEDLLLSEPRSFSFFQVIKILNSLLSEETEMENLSTTVNASKIKISPNLSFGFPSSNIDKIEKENNKFKVTANILGLYGTCSPLPSFYTEELFDDEDLKEETVRTFLDVINQRLYELLYAGWCKYKTMHKFLAEKSIDHQDILFSLIGLGKENLRKKYEKPEGYLKYSGLLNLSQRSASGLETILKDYFGNKAIKVNQAAVRKCRIPHDQRAVLGENLTLGNNSLIGTYCRDRMGCFSIEIETKDYREYSSFFPGKENHEKLKEIVSLYLTHQLEYRLIIKLEHNVKTICLGNEQRSKLGFNTCVLSGDESGKLEAVFFPGYI